MENVYEGDFVSISSSLYKVAWNKTTASFELVDLTSSVKYDICEVASGTVIGNQFQNADLHQIRGAEVNP